ncbi:serine/threonine-protein kinase [Glutamicibacter protophormiae]|uniref:serine/threonine-protein kinase n=1 Tax=Glutamicibacter protophormiae TaxID=37930 RepID=UPI002A812895|nr:serine/threonine-protein kinase [Glutamicibacter protophormiae]WPR63624.1 serine/threonine-protein kinase [Glutamicibacter protophormiae]WPR67119.1 serine/threonine-protein kinase [Glutamicibacter protophormiae]
MRTRLVPEEVAANYEYLEDLKPGTEADVILCEDRESGRLVVVKLYRFRENRDQSALMASLDHANADHVVEVIERGEFHGLPWEVQEYCLHGNLLEMGDLSQDLAVAEVFHQFAVQLLGALEYLHTINIVHRDLKPANVLVRKLEPLDLVLADFGLSRQIALSRDIGSVAGTFAYQSPETFRGEYGKPSDWWAAGTILYEMLAGRHFIANEEGRLPDDNLVRHSIASGTYELARIGNDRQWLLLRGLLTRNASHRWGAAEVETWFSGGSPTVYQEPTASVAQQMSTLTGAATSQVALSYRLGSTVARTSVELAAAIRKEWDQAMDLLVGRPDQKLTVWLEAQPQGAQAISLIRSGYSPAATLIGLQNILDPKTPAEFMGVAYPDFPNRIQAAHDGQRNAQSWLRDLRTLGALDGFAVTGTEDVGEAAGRLDAWTRQIREQMAMITGENAGAIDENLLAHEELIVRAAFGQGLTELQGQLRKTLDDLSDAGWAAPLLRNISNESAIGTRLVASMALTIAQSEIRGQRQIEAAARADEVRAQQRQRRAARRKKTISRLAKTAWKRAFFAAAWAAIVGLLGSTMYFQDADGLQNFMDFALAALVPALIGAAITIVADVLPGGSELGVGSTIVAFIMVLALVPIVAIVPNLDVHGLTRLPLWLAGAWTIRNVIGFALQHVWVRTAPVSMRTLEKERKTRTKNFRRFHGVACIAGWISILSGLAFLILSATNPDFSANPRATVDALYKDFPPYQWIVESIPYFDPLSIAEDPSAVIWIGGASAFALGLVPDLRRINNGLAWGTMALPVLFGCLVLFAVPWSIVGLVIGGGLVALAIGVALLLLFLVGESS